MPMTYTPFQFRPAQDTPPTSATPVSGHPSEMGSTSGADVSMPPYPTYHHHPGAAGGYMGPPPPPGYPSYPAPGYPHAMGEDASMHQPTPYAYAAYHPSAVSHYMAYPPPGVAAVHGRYASPDINGNLVAAGPPGVVFARASDPRIVRPKVKLTYDDKRRIVEIARSNTSLRQEDIAQQYG
jgi:hypothetical protein